MLQAKPAFLFCYTLFYIFFSKDKNDLIPACQGAPLIPPQQKTSSIKISNPVTGNSEFYIQGMTYKGKDNFIILVVDLLNKINSVQKGKTVVQILCKSLNMINIINRYPTDKNGKLRTNAQGKHMEALECHFLPNGGGSIDAMQLLKKQNDIIEMIAHELFHFYQKEKGQNAATVNGEVGAYLYGYCIEQKLNKNADFPYWGTGTSDGISYELAMSDLSDIGFTKILYQNALNFFKTGSRANNVVVVNAYKNHKIDPNYICLIQNFLPF